MLISILLTSISANLRRAKACLVSSELADSSLNALICSMVASETVSFSFINNSSSAANSCCALANDCSTTSAAFLIPIFLRVAIVLSLVFSLTFLRTLEFLTTAVAKLLKAF